MGLVDYSDSGSSDSEPETATKSAPRSRANPNAKKPFQKVVDRSNPGKILVNLPQSTANADSGAQSDGPPAKRPRTTGGSIFSGLNSFLPAPKNANKAVSKPSAGIARPGVHLKTSAEPGFAHEERAVSQDVDGSGMALPSPKRPAAPSIPEGQKAAEDVKMVGKPLMFKPLSVARNPSKKKTTKKLAPAGAHAPRATEQSAVTEPTVDDAKIPIPQPVKKMSLFSMHTEEPVVAKDNAQRSSVYEPMFQTEEAVDSAADEYAQYAAQMQTGPTVSTAAGAESLDSVVAGMNLTAAERRELFGRDGSHHGVKKVVNFNMDKEYQHNEEIRAAGEQQVHNPVRGIQSGKNSLQKLVQNVRHQRDALEDSFAQGKNNRKEAGSRYGWA